jgi:hypothetical protein
VLNWQPNSAGTRRASTTNRSPDTAAQLAKLGGLLGLSPVAERGLGSFTPTDDGDDPYAG